MNYFLLALNGLMLAVAALKYNVMPPIIPLFYSRAPQDAQLTPWWMIFIIPISMNVFYLANRKILKPLFPDNEFVAQFIRILNIILCTAFTAIFLKIIFLIT